MADKTPSERVAEWLLNFEIPKDWVKIRDWGDGVACQKGGLKVIVDVEVKFDNRAWMHVSVSRKHWTPTHEDISEAKNAFIGKDRYAYFVYPPEKVYVNLHAYCLHLWALLDDEDGRVLPEFSAPMPELGLERSI